MMTFEDFETFDDFAEWLSSPAEDVMYNGEILGLPVAEWDRLEREGYTFDRLEELDNAMLTEQIKRIQGAA